MRGEGSSDPAKEGAYDCPSEWLDSDNDAAELMNDEPGPTPEDPWLDGQYEAVPGGGIRRKKGLRKSIKKNLPDEIKQLLGEAHVAYVSNDIPHAMKCLQEVVRQDANVPDPYRTLAAIYEEIEQDKQRALIMYAILAKLEPFNHEMQKKGAELAMELNDNDVAYACLRRACFLDPDDHVLATDLAQTMANLGRVPQAVKSLRSHLKKFPDDIELYIELGLIAERDESCREAAVEAYAACLKRALKNALRPSVTALAGSCDFTITPEEQEAAEDHTYDGSGCVHIAFNAANSLCNLLMGDGKFADAGDVVESIMNWLDALRLQVEDDQECALEEFMLPLDLAVKAGICKIHAREVAQAEPFFEVLMEQNPAAEEFGSLFIDVAQAYLQVQMNKDAIKVLARVAESSAEGIFRKTAWLLTAEAWSGNGNIAMAQEAISRILNVAPHDCDALITLAKLCRQHDRRCAQNACDQLLPTVRQILREEASESTWATDSAHGEVGGPHASTIPDSVELESAGAPTRMKLLLEWGVLVQAATGDTSDLLSTYIAVVECAIMHKVNNDQVPKSVLGKVNDSDWCQALSSAVSALMSDMISEETDMQLLGLGKDYILHCMEISLRAMMGSAKLSSDADSLLGSVRQAGLISKTQKTALLMMCMAMSPNHNTSSVAGAEESLNDDRDSLRQNELDMQQEGRDIGGTRSRHLKRGSVDKRDLFNENLSMLKGDLSSMTNWEAVAQCIGSAATTTKRRRLSKLVSEHSESPVPYLLSGHDAMKRSVPKVAFKMYDRAVGVAPEEPLCWLSLSACLIRIMENERHVMDSLECLAKAMGCLQLSAELYRKWHAEPALPSQVGLTGIAEHFYVKVLSMEGPHLLDAAFNLVNLYKQSGALELARYTMKKYLSIETG